MTTEILFTTLVTLGGAAFLYLRNEIQNNRSEIARRDKIIEEQNDKIRQLEELLTKAALSIIDIADTKKPTSEAIKLSREILDKLNNRDKPISQ